VRRDARPGNDWNQPSGGPHFLDRGDFVLHCPNAVSSLENRLAFASSGQSLVPGCPRRGTRARADAGVGLLRFSVGHRHAAVFHFVSEGHAWLRIEGVEPIELAAAVPSLCSLLADLGGRPRAPLRRDEEANRNQFTERADSADHRQRTETYGCRT
jgi:hypothetical protein